VRAICPHPTYATILSASFDQIRQNGTDKPLILIHLLRALEQIARCAETKEQRSALGEQVRNILADAERGIANPSDLADVQGQARQAVKVLEGAIEARPG
jgi:uncharacterized membrane protein